ncbi:DNA-binding response regulator, LytR/AlgR family [Pseudarcicella hirudinis]|uniref:DNA-binding response regulator, LytR/AlgR family n=1 Tax=Pseudarcicella hirudinis TaxID=1079859 RepID=A0A1I5YIS3_9BACT|nr:LytTR family DNA-binding domain-containing protein [Pseudarcicella hirudinis]SFQ44114.1 DNA-binding response regulator, LytR/AlgR family [Pseudarcicella hirudinis]
MKITAIAIDDEPLALEVVQIFASKVPFVELAASFTDAFEAITFLKQHKIDLIFLDIKMPDISGIEFINCLQKVPMVIFTTAYSEYAVEGFELDAIDFLLKPFSLARFTKSCNKALDFKRAYSGEAKDYIFIKTGYEEEKVMLDEISYIEAAGNYMTFVLKTRKLLSRQTITEVLNLLPLNQFMRIHRSYIVPIGKINKISRQSIWIGTTEIPIGVSFEEKVQEIKNIIAGS